MSSTVRLHSKSVIGLLLTAGAALVASFVLAPAALLSPTFGDFNEPTLRDALGGVLVEYWRSGTPAFPARLTTLVEYWFLWHAIKVAISAMLVIVLLLLTVALWRRYLRAGPGYAVAATAATVLTVLAGGLLMANFQATVVPPVALLPLLPGRTADGALAQVLGEMREGLTDSASLHAGSAALTVLLSEAEQYHWVMAAVAATLMVATGLASVHFWKRRIGARPRYLAARRPGCRLTPLVHLLQ